MPSSAVNVPRADGTKAQDLEEQVAARPAKDAKPLHDEALSNRRGSPRGGFFVSPRAGARDLPAPHTRRYPHGRASDARACRHSGGSPRGAFYATHGTTINRRRTPTPRIAGG